MDRTLVGQTKHVLDGAADPVRGEVAGTVPTLIAKQKSFVCVAVTSQATKTNLPVQDKTS